MPAASQLVSHTQIFEDLFTYVYSSYWGTHRNNPRRTIWLGYMLNNILAGFSKEIHDLFLSLMKSHMSSVQ